MKIKEGFVLRNIMGQATVIGEGAALVNFNKLVTFNDTAAYLWENICGKEFDEDTLASLLIGRYGIDEALAQRDAKAISSQWAELGLTE